MNLKDSFGVAVMYAVVGLVIGGIAGYIAMYIDIPAGLWDEYNLSTLPIGIELQYYGWDWLWTTPLAAAMLGFIYAIFSGE